MSCENGASSSSNHPGFTPFAALILSPVTLRCSYVPCNENKIKRPFGQVLPDLTESSDIFFFFLICPGCIQRTRGLPSQRGKSGPYYLCVQADGSHSGFAVRNGEIFSSAIRRIPPAVSQRSSASCLCVYSQAWSRSAGPRGGGAQSSGFTAGAQLHASHDWSSGKKVVMIARTAGVSERL